MIKSRHELETTIQKIYESGYSNSLIIQDMIPGNDEYMRVLTSYSGKDKKVKMMCLGHVLLRGTYTAWNGKSCTYFDRAE